MDRTAVFDTTQSSSARKPTALKYTESFLCDEIHNNLRALSFLVPFNADLDAVFAHGMFIKPNTRAFPHVTRYLLIIYDATEFRKKFRWPIFDKAGEALFRNSTMEALNKLNIKYDLGLGEIKNKILVFPGGLEFMRVIFEISRLCMQLLLKRHCATNTSTEELTLTYVGDKTRNIENLYDVTKRFSCQLHSAIDSIQIKTRELNTILDKAIANTNFTAANILVDEFLDSWMDVQSNIVENAIQPSIIQINTFYKLCEQLLSHIQTIFNSEKANYNAADLDAFIVNMQSMSPQNSQQILKIVSNGQLRIDRLLIAFQLAIPAMIQSIQSSRTRSMDVLSYESVYMHDLSHVASGIFQKALQLNITSKADCSKHDVTTEQLVQSSMSTNFKSLILSTPPITYDAAKRLARLAIQTKRISLMDAEPIHMRATPMLRSIDEQSTHASNTINSTLANRNVFRAPFLPNAPNETINKRLDPMRALRAVNRKPNIGSPKRTKRPKSGHLDNLFSHQSNDTTMSIPDFSSTLIANEIKCNSHNISDHINMSMAKALSTPTRAPNIDYVSPIVATDHHIRRTQIASMRQSLTADMNLSPSGHIEPLARTLIAPGAEITNMHKNTLKGAQADSFSEWISKRKGNQSASDGSSTLIVGCNSFGNQESRCIDIKDIENDLNVSNRPKLQNLANLIDENDECLLNVSDGILADIDTSF